MAPVQVVAPYCFVITFPRAKLRAGADQPAAFRMSPFLNLPLSFRQIN